MKDNEKQQQNDCLRQTIVSTQSFCLGVCKKTQRKISKKTLTISTIWISNINFFCKNSKNGLKINRTQTKVNHFLVKLKLFENPITLDAGKTTKRNT